MMSTSTNASLHSETIRSADPLIKVKGIAKHYGAIRALDGVDIDIRPGEVHSLVGANGAGKSTLVRILAGVEQPDRGELRIDGGVVQLHRPTDAGVHGLSFVHQELNLVGDLTVLQNLAMGLPIPIGFMPWASVRARAEEVFEELGAALPLGARADELSVSDRWTVSLVRGLMRPARFIAMDEPTASFTQQEADRLFDLIHRLRSNGTAILYISHRLEEVLDLSDRITVFRDGRRVEEHGRGDLDVRGLAKAIAGADVTGPRRAERHDATGEIMFEASGVALGKRVHDVNLEVRAGEILGIAGLVGAGRTEFVRAVAGADPVERGEMRLAGKRYAPKSPAAALAQGVALVPEERRSEALVLDESVAFNVVLAAPDRAHAAPWLPMVTPRATAAVAKQMIERFRIKTDSPERPVRSLSGGNQQKVVISRFVAGAPRLFILDEPTVGVDVGAREEIYSIISELAATGTAIVVVSSDFDELQICDRVVVFREGRTVASLPHQQATKSALTHLCFDDAEPEQSSSALHSSSDENGKS